jgi:hypothetical protein
MYTIILTLAAGKKDRSTQAENCLIFGTGKRLRLKKKQHFMEESLER